MSGSTLRDAEGLEWAAMVDTPSLWLIGVRRDELDAAGKPSFLSQLQHRFRGRDLKREGRLLLVRDVPYPDYITSCKSNTAENTCSFTM